MKIKSDIKRKIVKGTINEEFTGELMFDTNLLYEDRHIFDVDVWVLLTVEHHNFHSFLRTMHSYIEER
jgi:hypothetical protein